MVSSGMFLHSVRRLLVAACVVPNSPILVTLMEEVPGSSETSVLSRATRRNIPEDTILYLPHYFASQNAVSSGKSSCSITQYKITSHLSSTLLHDFIFQTTIILIL
jgi:hypothetical protein